MKASDFIGTHASYDKESQKIWGNNKEGMQMIADLRGWGAIQNLFKNRDGSIRLDEAEKYQDDLGEWIADAINQKLTNKKTQEKTQDGDWKDKYY